MEKEKKQEELQKRLDEIDEENLRAERERRKKQEEEYDSLYGAELERKKKLQASSMASMLDELDSLGGGDISAPSEPLDPDAAMFALTPGAASPAATRLTRHRVQRATRGKRVCASARRGCIGRLSASRAAEAAADADAERHAQQ